MSDNEIVIKLKERLDRNDINTEMGFKHELREITHINIVNTFNSIEYVQLIKKKKNSR